MEALRVETLSKYFGGVSALRNVTFSVESGEKVAIIGPNGAGKTTLFNVLNGQLAPSTGRIFLYGKDITHLPTYCRAHLGQSRSFQITTLLPRLTVLENCLVALQGKQPSRFNMLRPIRAYRELFTRAGESLGAVALWEKRDEPVRNISYGEQRKLEIAISLASQPKLLLLDEPSSGLTAGEGAAIVDMIRGLRGITTLVVAHDMDLVFGVAERIMVLHYGEIIAHGTPEEIRVNPKVREIYIGTGGATHAGAG